MKTQMQLCRWFLFCGLEQVTLDFNFAWSKKMVKKFMQEACQQKELCTLYKWMKDQQIWDNIVLLATSAFGRTLTPNSNHRSDHAWGSNCYIAIGGGLKGRKILRTHRDYLTLDWICWMVLGSNRRGTWHCCTKQEWSFSWNFWAGAIVWSGSMTHHQKLKNVSFNFFCIVWNGHKSEDEKCVLNRQCGCHIHFFLTWVNRAFARSTLKSNFVIIEMEWDESIMVARWFWWWKNLGEIWVKNTDVALNLKLNFQKHSRRMQFGKHTFATPSSHGTSLIFRHIDLLPLMWEILVSKDALMMHDPQLCQSALFAITVKSRQFFENIIAKTRCKTTTSFVWFSIMTNSNKEWGANNSFIHTSSSSIQSKWLILSDCQKKMGLRKFEQSLKCDCHGWWLVIGIWMLDHWSSELRETQSLFPLGNHSQMWTPSRNFFMTISVLKLVAAFGLIPLGTPPLLLLFMVKIPFALISLTVLLLHQHCQDTNLAVAFHCQIVIHKFAFHQLF